MSDDPITEFVVITGASAEQAQQILETVNYNVEEGINLFFASQDGGGAMNTSTGPGSFPSIPEEDDIPPPVTTTTQDQLIMRPDQHRHHAPQAPEPPRALFDGSALAALFRPPDYCFHGTFDQAKTFAAKEKKWLLVNILGIDCFPSNQLNRDTWAHDTVQSTVVTYFTFWQQQSGTPHGDQYSALYRVSEFPHCAIIDPRTGEALCKWSGFLNPDQMHDKLTHFLDRDMTMDEDEIPQESRLPSGGPGSGAAPMATDEDAALQEALMASAKEASAAGSEEDEIAAAIAASLQESGSSAAAPAAPPAPAVEFKPSVDLTAVFSDEAFEGSARVMLQLADSTSHRKHAKLSASTEALYDFAKVAIPEAQTRPFKLLYGFPPKGVPQGPGCTLESAGLQNERINMVWE